MHALSALRHALSLRPLTLPFAISPRMRARVPSLLSDTPSHYALAPSPLASHECLLASHALSSRTHMHIARMSSLLSNTPSHYALAPSPLASHACPLTPSHLAHATTHIACMPSLLSDMPSHYALSRSPPFCPLISHACMRALSALTLELCVVSSLSRHIVLGTYRVPSPGCHPPLVV